MFFQLRLHYPVPHAKRAAKYSRADLVTVFRINFNLVRKQMCVDNQRNTI